MTYGILLSEAAKTLPDPDTAFLDATLLLAHCLSISRTELLSRLSLAWDPESNKDALAVFQVLLERRRSGESVAAILGEKEFFGRSFMVNGAVLIPRPDTETLVQAALEVGDQLELLVKQHSGAKGSSCGVRVHDACTGSGAVAISIACERPLWQVSASDISEEALSVARQNSIRLLEQETPRKEIEFFPSDLLSTFLSFEASHETKAEAKAEMNAEIKAERRAAFDIITANPPYVPHNDVDAMFETGCKEPRLALDGGQDGLDYIRRLIPQAKTLLAPGGYLLFESDPFQVASICAMLTESGFEGLRVWLDLAGRQRVTGGHLPSAD
ncbi:MAG TPA: peptide chain release factor N(5)-glutamine methyltransferase [Spirochaetales bacterium]|nr:peptide chain release factor N(5)-glutamine methyltransferase [Spirochaetales bacterium]